MSATTYPVLRWQCRCGRFVAESAITETNHRDDSYYYGVRTETQYSCSRCGLVDDSPRLIEVGHRPMPEPCGDCRGYGYMSVHGCGGDERICGFGCPVQEMCRACKGSGLT